MHLYKAVVIDDNDTNVGDSKNLSRIKVRLLPEMNGIDESLLPWVRPFFVEGITELNNSHNPPEIGSNIKCIFIDDYYKQGFYLKGDFIDGFFSWDSVVHLLSKINELGNQTYPNPRFTQLPDGSIVFYNTVTREMGILHSSGTYAMITASGGMSINAIDKIVLQAPEIDLIGIVNESVPQKVVNHVSHQENVTGLKQENIGGSKTVSIGSSLHETVLDEKGELTTGNRIMTIGGNLAINLPGLTSSVTIECGLGNIVMDGATGKITINGNLEIDL